MKNERFSTVDREIQGIFPVFPFLRVHLAQQGQQSLAAIHKLASANNITICPVFFAAKAMIADRCDVM